MKRRPQWTAERNAHASILRGHGSREALAELTGRPPLYVASARGWSCQADTLDDACALAQARGIDVEVMGSRAARSRAVEALLAAPLPRWSATQVDTDDDTRALW